jgi:RES domain-containing protein
MSTGIYCAPALAMAVLETAAHVDDAGLPLDRYVVEIVVPDDVWSARERLGLGTLPPGCDAIPAGMASVRHGSAWLRSRWSAISLVPSVIVPEEDCALINPQHPDASRITARTVRKFEYDSLFRKA